MTADDDEFVSSDCRDFRLLRRCCVAIEKKMKQIKERREKRERKTTFEGWVRVHPHFIRGIL